MRKNYIYALAVVMAVAGCPALVSGQEKKDKIDREMVIEKEYTPMVRDASKINVLPEIEPPAVKKNAIHYSDWSVPVNPGNRLELLPAADFDTQHTFSKKRGYANLGLGNYLNIGGDVGYRFIDKEKDLFGAWFQHNSTNGHVKYTDGSGKAKLMQNDNLFQLYYRHHFSKVSLDLDGDYRYNMFNYYGKEILTDIPATDVLTNEPAVLPYSDLFPKSGLPDFAKNQVVQQYGFRAGIVSRPGDQPLDYSASVAYRGYQSRLGRFYGESGGKEHHIDTRFGMSSKFREIYRIGLSAQMDNLIYQNTRVSDYTMISLNPYFDINREKMKLRLGLMANLTFNQGPVVRFAPDIHFDWEFARSFFLFADLDGGKRLNTFANLSMEDIYLNPSERPVDSYCPVDATVGVRSNYFSGFSFELFGGFKSVDDELFNVRMLEGIAFENVTRNYVEDFAYDVYRWNVGAMLKYKYNDRFNAGLKFENNSWHLRDGGESIQLNKPRWEVRLDAAYKINKQISVKLDYYLATGREYLNISDISNPQGMVEAGDPRYSFSTVTESGKLKNIHALNAGATYQFNETFHLFLNLNNILAQRYDIWYGMPAQGFNFMLGAGVKF